MAILEEIKETQETKEVPAAPLNGNSYEVRVREDLMTVSCTICQLTFDGAGIDVSPVDTVCLVCGSAIAKALGQRGLDVAPPVRSYEDLLPDDGTPPLTENDPPAKPKRTPRKRTAKK